MEPDKSNLRPQSSRVRKLCSVLSVFTAKCQLFVNICTQTKRRLFHSWALSRESLVIPVSLRHRSPCHGHAHVSNTLRTSLLPTKIFKYACVLFFLHSPSNEWEISLGPEKGEIIKGALESCLLGGTLKKSPNTLCLMKKLTFIITLSRWDLET